MTDWQRNGKSIVEKGYVTSLIGDEAVRLIEKQDKSKPFFLYFASLAPHAPYQAPTPDTERYASTIKDPTRRTYAAMITSLDDQVGRIVAALDKRGLRENTLIIFSSDNGGPRSAVVASGAHSKEEREAGGVTQATLPAR
jgi:arylsulfatase A-like enzyme